MPIRVICSGCNATLNAPDTAAGKKLKCPKCQTICAIPDAEPLTDSVRSQPPPLPSATKRSSEEESRPRRSDDEDESPVRRHRGPRRDAHETAPSTSGQMALGGTAIGLGVVAFAFSFIPCCGMPFALGFGALGLLCGGIGVVLALAAEKRGIALPSVGSGLCVLAMIISVACYFVAVNWSKNPIEAAGKQMEIENKRATDEAKRRQDEFKQQQDEIRKKQQGGTPPNAIERQVTQTNLSQIGLKFIGYNEGKNFPMSSVRGEGKLSWRVAILEDIDRNHYNLFKHNEAWNSPHNIKILNTTSMPKIFESGRMKPGEDRKTYFRLFTGPGTLYPAANSRPKMDMITAGAGASNTWLLAEGKNAVEWTKPDELVVNGGQFPQLGGAYGVGFFVLCADGKSHYVHQDQFSRDALLQLVNPTRAEQVAGWPPN